MKYLILLLLSLNVWAGPNGEWKSVSRPTTYLYITSSYFIFRDFGRFMILKHAEVDASEHHFELFTGREPKGDAKASTLSRGSHDCIAHVVDNSLSLSCDHGAFKRDYLKEMKSK